MKGMPMPQYLLEVLMGWALESQSHCSDSALGMGSVSPPCQICELILMKGRVCPAGDRGRLPFEMRMVCCTC
jgi:hypothetical protein